MTIIDSQVHAYEANTPKRPWHSVPNWPDHVTGGTTFRDRTARRLTAAPGPGYGKTCAMGAPYCARGVSAWICGLA
jgi:hypothetical protein